MTEFNANVVIVNMYRTDNLGFYNVKSRHLWFGYRYILSLFSKHNLKLEATSVLVRSMTFGREMRVAHFSQLFFYYFQKIL